MQSGLAPVGVLADFLEVEPRYERVVEDFLRDELNYVVVKSWDAADEGLRMLRTGVDGRATFLVHPEDAQAKFSFVLDEAAHCAPPSSSDRPAETYHSRARTVSANRSKSFCPNCATATSFPSQRRARPGTRKS
jgi:hypothetical protein